MVYIQERVLQTVSMNEENYKTSNGDYYNSDLCIDIYIVTPLSK